MPQIFEKSTALQSNGFLSTFVVPLTMPCATLLFPHEIKPCLLTPMPIMPVISMTVKVAVVLLSFLIMDLFYGLVERNHALLPRRSLYMLLLP